MRALASQVVGGAVIKRLAVVGLFLACSACAKSQSSSAFVCDAFQSKSSERQLRVINLYVFGDYHHGVIAVTKDCPEHAKRMRIVEEEGEQKKGSSAAAGRVGAFKKALLLSPKIKSGMFKVDAAVYIDGINDRIGLKDVTHFEEVSRNERDEIFELLRNSRKAE